MRQTKHVYSFSKSKTKKGNTNLIKSFQMDRKFCIQIVVLQNTNSWMVNTANNTLTTLVQFWNLTIQ